MTSPAPVDANLNPNGHVLTAAIAPDDEGLPLPMAGALDGSSAANLFNSISYGINFDVKDADVSPSWHDRTLRSWPTSPIAPVLQRPSSLLLALDRGFPVF